MKKHRGFLDVFVLKEFLDEAYICRYFIYRIRNIVWWPSGDEPVFFDI